MSAQRTSVFLERQTYRRRRIMDAARLIPVLGAALFAVPLLWPKGDAAETGAGAAGQAAAGAAPVAMSAALIYIFSVWALLILLAFLFGLKSRGWGPVEPGSGRARPRED